MIKQIIIQVAVNGFSILVISEGTIQDGTKIKITESQRIFIAHNQEELHKTLDEILKGKFR